MASTNKTTNYELSQFVSSDIPAWLSDYNGDMSKIDAGIHAAKVQADGAASGVSALQTAVSGKQDRLTFDTTPLSGSSNPVTSSGIYNALQNAQVQTDGVPTAGSTKPVQSGGVYTALQGKQNTLTFDSTPTQGSANPVTSGGVYNALQNESVYPTFLSVITTSNIKASAVKIGKMVLVNVSGWAANGGLITIQGVTKASAPAVQYYFTNSNTGMASRILEASDITNSAGNTNIQLETSTADDPYVIGTFWFECA